MQDLGNAIANSYGETVGYDHNVTMTGGNLSAQKNIGKRWAAAIDVGAFSGTKVADLSRYFQLLGYIPNNITQESTFKASLYTIMVGPQINLWSYHNAHFFVRGMGGALHNSLSVDDTTRKALDFLAPKYATSATDFAVMGGVGVQYPVYHNIFVRASGDYIHPFSTSTQNYFRISAGIGIARFKLF
jgi:opacity protein-like surface antigen